MCIFNLCVSSISNVGKFISKEFFLQVYYNKFTCKTCWPKPTSNRPKWSTNSEIKSGTITSLYIKSTLNAKTTLSPCLILVLVIQQTLKLNYDKKRGKLCQREKKLYIKILACRVEFIPFLSVNKPLSRSSSNRQP